MKKAIPFALAVAVAFMLTAPVYADEATPETAPTKAAPTKVAPAPATAEAAAEPVKAEETKTEEAKAEAKAEDTKDKKPTTLPAVNPEDPGAM